MTNKQYCLSLKEVQNPVIDLAALQNLFLLLKPFQESVNGLNDFDHSKKTKGEGYEHNVKGKNKRNFHCFQYCAT